MHFSDVLGGQMICDTNVYLKEKSVKGTLALKLLNF